MKWQPELSLARKEMTEELKRLLECVGSGADRQSWCCWLITTAGTASIGDRSNAPVNTVKTRLRRSMMDPECLGLEMQI